MTALNTTRTELESKLKAPYFRFPRAQELRRNFADCLGHYYASAKSERRFEARGMLVTGQSRVGKTRELDKLIEEFNASETVMPDGRPGIILQICLWGRATPKDVACAILDDLGHPSSRMTENQLWSLVHRQARLTGVIGVHIDEMQHGFSDSGTSHNKSVLSTLKQILKNRDWPMLLILSGVPELARHLEKDNDREDRAQLRHLLRPLHIECINPHQDLELLHDLCHSYADVAKINLEPVASWDLYENLAKATGYRWGLLIEMLIEALLICAEEGFNKISLQHFDQAFVKTYGISQVHQPFTDPNYLEEFDPENLYSLIDRTR